MSTKLEQEEYLYRRAIDIIESPDTDEEKEALLFQEVWVPLAELYKDTISKIYDQDFKNIFVIIAPCSFFIFF